MKKEGTHPLNKLPFQNGMSNEEIRQILETSRSLVEFCADVIGENEDVMRAHHPRSYIQ